jgi:hypothetical protein
MIASREQVYDAVSNERDYQDFKWSEHTTLSGGRHSPAEWLVYMQDYLSEAIHQAARYADPQGRDMVLHTIRKITAMGVACMEQNGAPRRVS